VRPLLLLVAMTAPALAQMPQPEPLWPGRAPGALGEGDADRPALTTYLPAPGRAAGSAVVVCPGGGYVGLAMGHEGADIARWLNERGVAAFVLKYRLGPRYHHPVQLGDVQRAIRTVRTRAPKLGIAADKIGVWGFSAGGHLASSAATLFDDGDAKAQDPIDHASSRPDFAILGYPVIFMGGEGTHMGSRRNLLGDAPSDALVEKLSTNRQVTARTPPTFLFHTTDDAGVPVENSVQFYLALRRAGVPAEMHLYQHGRHGVGLAPADPALSSWPALLDTWLRQRGLVPPATKQ
jgi:acetyl esterase/lipase